MESEQATHDSTSSPEAKFESLVMRARAAGWWERAWPKMMPPMGLSALFVTASSVGLWTALPPEGRAVGVALFSSLMIASLSMLRKAAFPTRQEGIDKLDRESGQPHRPASTFNDRIATGQKEGQTWEVWQDHRRKIAGNLEHLRGSMPSPKMPAHDPYAIRFVLPLIAGITFVGAGEQRFDNMAAAFDWSTPIEAPVPPRIDAWVTPPDYTGVAPLFLTENIRRAENQPALGSRIEVPEGGILTVRISNGTAKLTATGGISFAEGAPRIAGQDELIEYRLRLTGDSEVSLTSEDGNILSWTFDVTPDQAPLIANTSPEEQAPYGSLNLNYRLGDDYGITSGDVRMEPAPRDNTDNPVPPPRFPLIPR